MKHSLLFLTILTLPLIHLPAAQAQLRTEVVNGDTLYIYKVPAMTRFLEQIDLVINFQDSVYTYNYTVSSSPESEQSVYYFAIFSDAKVFDEIGPNRWRARNGGTPYSEKRIQWGAQTDPVLIKPGDVQGPFTFKTHSLPTIHTFYMEAWVEDDIVEVEPDSVENAGFLSTAKKGLTVFPREAIDFSSSAAIADTLQAFTVRSCYELSWARGPVCGELESRVAAVKAALSQSKEPEAAALQEYLALV